MDTGRRHDERHDQCGGEAVRGDVAQHDTDPLVAEPAEGVEVTANRVHGTADRGHLSVALQHRG